MTQINRWLNILTSYSTIPEPKLRFGFRTCRFGFPNLSSDIRTCRFGLGPNHSSKNAHQGHPPPHDLSQTKRWSFTVNQTPFGDSQGDVSLNVGHVPNLVRISEPGRFGFSEPGSDFPNLVRTISPKMQTEVTPRSPTQHNLSQTKWLSFTDEQTQLGGFRSDISQIMMKYWYKSIKNGGFSRFSIPRWGGDQKILSSYERYIFSRSFALSHVKIGARSPEKSEKNLSQL